MNYKKPLVSKTLMASDMTMVDYFAAKAMAAIICNVKDYNHLPFNEAADCAYSFAEAMMEERPTFSENEGENEGS